MNQHQRPDGPWRIEPEVLEEALNTEFSRRSVLLPVLKNWTEDLPKNDKAQQTAPRLTWVNQINDIWLEIPRYENLLWWGGWVVVFFSLIIIPLCTYILSDAVSDYVNGDVNIFIILFFMLALLFFISVAVLNLRMVLFVPRGAPVRFNRKRQKVYVYEYQRNWNPWVRWPTTVKVFDWADVYGQMSRETGRYDQGYRLYGTVCKPGTHEVIDRFALSFTVGHPKLLRGLWSHCCQYMQHKPVPTRPLYRERPLSWCPINNIHWPEDIDRESTTAPDA
ncbi:MULTISPECIES: DUF6708 domain-containing protein [Yersinia pseudotuberculosis complex]|uniref:DUF6708 domain-containing protein n=1 Tax=Yersinia wautersii TaxID=1341643 RepID=A0ABM9TK25_9GAMM|nr:DUF6708 domain-containing protein [Yersinia wautersii]BET63191.1 hypothetical protein YPSE1_26500 [Yersinia pseudotuberculosis]CRG52263.1 Uncharacterised protein [Yersinia wautersii]